MYSIIVLKLVSIKKMIKEIIMEAIITTTPLLCNSLQVGQLTLFFSSSVDSSMYVLIFDIYIFLLHFVKLETSRLSTFCAFYLHGWRDSLRLRFSFVVIYYAEGAQGKLLVSAPFCAFFCTGGETRTPSQWFWRPLLYQLSYTRKFLSRKKVSRFNRDTFHN